MAPPSDQDLIRRNARTGMIVLAVVLGMGALAFASAPLYDLFCRTTGFGGTTQTSQAFPEKVLDRTITVSFNADTGPGMPWDFRPEVPRITLKLGARGLTSFYAHNKMATPTAGTALYNVTPPKAGKYFHKVQCFCFDKQTLAPGQAVDMPVLFYVDPSMNDDPDMDDVDDITLSYTFYPADSKALEDATEAFYNSPSK
mgnify:FL=1